MTNEDTQVGLDVIKHHTMIYQVSKLDYKETETEINYVEYLSDLIGISLNRRKKSYEIVTLFKANHLSMIY